MLGITDAAQMALPGVALLDLFGGISVARLVLNSLAVSVVLHAVWEIDEFANEHFDGTGFTDVYVRDEQKIKTSDRNINLIDFEQFIVSLGFQKMRNVYSGYGNYKEKCQNTNAYSIDRATIFCDYENRLIKNIWLDGFRFNNESKFGKEMTEGLFQIGKQWNLTLNDWDLTERINLKDKSEIELYIKEK